MDLFLRRKNDRDMIVSFVLNHPGSILEKENKREEYVRLVLKGIKQATREAQSKDILLPMEQERVNQLSSLFPDASIRTTDNTGYIQYLISKANPRYLIEEWERRLNYVLIEQRYTTIQALDVLRHFQVFLRVFAPIQIISIKEAQLVSYLKYIEYQQHYNVTVAVMALQLFYKHVLNYFRHVIYSYTLDDNIAIPENSSNNKIRRRGTRNRNL